MKPKVVIFSSSEKLPLAKNIALWLRTDVECTVWKNLPFALANYTPQELVAFAKEHDFALFIFGYEDKAVIRGKECNVTRDNVIYEFGLMSGLIAPERCFIIECVSESIPNPHSPSDIKGIITVPFNTDCTDKENELHACVTIIMRDINRLGRKQKKYVNENLVSQLSNIGLSAFYAKRADFGIFRRENDTSSPLEKPQDYLSIARKSIKAIVFSYFTSNVFENVRPILEEKLKSFPGFEITISLLNPYDTTYYSSCYMTHDRTGIGDLVKEAEISIGVLREFRDSLNSEAKERFHIKFHNTALFEPAILIDDDEDYGRIQVEIHAYKEIASERYAFEIKKSKGNSEFYNKILST